MGGRGVRRKQLLDDLQDKEDTGIRKRKLKIALCRELVLAEDLLQDRRRNEHTTTTTTTNATTNS